MRNKGKLVRESKQFNNGYITIREKDDKMKKMIEGLKIENKITGKTTNLYCEIKTTIVRITPLAEKIEEFEKFYIDSYEKLKQSIDEIDTKMCVTSAK